MASINVSVLNWNSAPDLQHHRREYAWGAKYHNPIQLGYLFAFQLSRVSTPAGINRLEVIRDEDGQAFNILAAASAAGLTVVPGDRNDTIKYLGTVPLPGAWTEGLYYAIMSDGVTTWYSDYFTMVIDISDMVKVEWWHNTPMEYRDGCIDYAYPYRNYVYFKTHVAKPKYPVVEQADDRAGRKFVHLTSSWKEHRFATHIPEYLADVMRLIRGHDNVRVYYLGQVFECESFTMEDPQWEEQGDLADTTFTFVTDTFVIARTQSSSVSDGGGSSANPSQCLDVRFVVNSVVRDLNTVGSDLGALGIVGDHIGVDLVLDFGGGPFNTFTVRQITHLNTNPQQTRLRELDEGDVIFDLTEERYYVQTNQTFGLTEPRWYDLIDNNDGNYTLLGYGLPGTTIQLYYKEEFTGWMLYQAYPSEDMNTGIVVPAATWFAVKAVFLSATCGPLQETPTFFLTGGGGDPPERLTGLDYDYLDVNLDLQ